MPTLTVLTDPHPSLRTPAQPVAVVDEAVRGLLGDMLETMYAERGIGLAAPQVGQAVRCIVMDLGPPGRRVPYLCVNPTIVKRRGLRRSEEGCLSIPGETRLRERAEQVEMTALDEHGVPFRLKASGLLAACIQHEIDHLDGRLFTDPLEPTLP